MNCFLHDFAPSLPNKVSMLLWLSWKLLLIWLASNSQSSSCLCLSRTEAGPRLILAFFLTSSLLPSYRKHLTVVIVNYQKKKGVQWGISSRRLYLWPRYNCLSTMLRLGIGRKIQGEHWQNCRNVSTFYPRPLTPISSHSLTVNVCHLSPEPLV